MRKPPSEHDEWLEENREPEKQSPPLPRKRAKAQPTNHPSGAEKRFKALNDDIQEFG